MNFQSMVRSVVNEVAKTTPAMGSEMQAQHITNLPSMLTRANVKLTDDQLSELIAIIRADYANYPRTPLRNRTVRVFVNASGTLYTKTGFSGLQCDRTTAGNFGLLTVEVTRYNS
jgi:ethanolamine ammonia-lyase small subunit